MSPLAPHLSPTQTLVPRAGRYKGTYQLRNYRLIMCNPNCVCLSVIHKTPRGSHAAPKATGIIFFSKGTKNSKHLAVLPVELFSRIPFCCQTMAFQAGLLSSKKDESLRCAYQEGQPFPHMVIQGVMQHDFLRQVRSEISRNLDSSSMKTRCTA